MTEPEGADGCEGYSANLRRRPSARKTAQQANALMAEPEGIDRVSKLLESTTSNNRSQKRPDLGSSLTRGASEGALLTQL